MEKTDAVRIRHMLDAAREAAAFGAGRNAEDLRNDRIRTLAIVKAVEIIGEAASKLSRDFRSAHPEIPWTDIIGMRNRLIHVYFDVDPNRVCDTVAVDLPPLISALEAILANEGTTSFRKER